MASSTGYPLMRFLCFLFCALLSNNLWAQYPYDGLQQHPLYKYYSYYEDTKGDLTATQVQALLASNKFLKWKGITFNKGISNSIFWFHIPIQNVTGEPQKAILRLSTKIDQLSVYQTDSIENTLLYNTSSYTPFDSRPFPHRYICLPLHLPPLSTKHFLLMVDNRGRGLYMPMSLQSAEKVLRAEQSRHWTYGIYFGIFLFIILFNIFLYFSMRDTIHLWYSGYVLSAILFMIGDEKFYTELFPDRLLHYFENAWTPPFALLMMGASLKVMQLFIDQKKGNSKFFHFTQVLMVTCFLLSFIMLVLSFLDPILVLPILKKMYFFVDLMIVPSTFLLIIISVVEKMRQGQSLAGYYLIAVLLLIAGALNFYFNHLGITNINVLKPNGVVVGLAFELIFLSLLLTVRYNRLKKEKEVIKSQQQQLLAEAVIQTQENEKKRLASDLHDDLASKLTDLSRYVKDQTRKEMNEPERQAFHSQLTSLLDKSYDDLVTIAHDLMPKVFSEQGIAKVLADKIQAMNENQSIHFDFQFSGEESKISKDKQLSLFRICSELLHNIIKHSKATKASLQCLLYDDHVQVLVEDNGVGIKKERQEKMGIGLASVSSRVQYLNGKMTLDSSGAGTTFVIEIPLA